MLRGIGRLRAKAATAAAGDPYWNQVVLLVPGNGSNSGTTFTDIKGNALSIVSGAPITTTADYQWGGSSILLSPGDTIQAAASSNWAFSGDFTVEYWAKPIAGISTIAGMLSTGNSAEGFANAWIFALLVNAGGPGIVADGAFTLTSDTLSTTEFNHYAWTRASGVETLFCAGQILAQQTPGVSYSANQLLRIGDYDGPNDAPRINAYVNDLRITNGVARYTEAFTPPTEPFPTY